MSNHWLPLALCLSIPDILWTPAAIQRIGTVAGRQGREPQRVLEELFAAHSNHIRQTVTAHNPHRHLVTSCHGLAHITYVPGDGLQSAGMLLDHIELVMVSRRDVLCVDSEVLARVKQLYHCPALWTGAAPGNDGYSLSIEYK